MDPCSRRWKEEWALSSFIFRDERIIVELFDDEDQEGVGERCETFRRNV